MSRFAQAMLASGAIAIAVVLAATREAPAKGGFYPTGPTTSTKLENLKPPMKLCYEGKVVLQLPYALWFDIDMEGKPKQCP